MSEKVFLFAVGGFLSMASKRKVKEVSEIVSRTVGFIGYTDAERGTLLVYNSLDNAESAWHKLAEHLTVANNIMEGEFTNDRHQLTVGGIARRMRLN